jgi:Natural resistance-associated macrophage protein-like
MNLCSRETDSLCTERFCSFERSIARSIDLRQQDPAEASNTASTGVYPLSSIRLFLKWLTLFLLSYAAVLFMVHAPWGDVAFRRLWPNLKLDSEAATVVTGVFGTTISPYLFFWQASEEIEDMQRQQNAAPLMQDAGAAGSELRRIRWDTWSGMFYSDATAYFIILATAVTLNVAGVSERRSIVSAQTSALITAENRLRAQVRWARAMSRRVNHIISSVRQALPVCHRLRTCRCNALTGAMGPQPDIMPSTCMARWRLM